MSLIDELLCPVCRDLYVEKEDRKRLVIFWHAKDVKKEDGTLSSLWCEVPKSMLEAE